MPVSCDVLNGEPNKLTRSEIERPSRTKPPLRQLQSHRQNDPFLSSPEEEEIGHTIPVEIPERRSLWPGATFLADAHTKERNVSRTPIPLCEEFPFLHEAKIHPRPSAGIKSKEGRTPHFRRQCAV